MFKVDNEDASATSLRRWSAVAESFEFNASWEDNII